MRVLLKGIHKVRYRLASGQVATYHYAGRAIRAGSIAAAALERESMRNGRRAD